MQTLIFLYKFFSWRISGLCDERSGHSWKNTQIANLIPYIKMNWEIGILNIL